MSARWNAKEGVRMQLGHIITQLARTPVKERARELAGLSRRPPWRARLTVQLARLPWKLLKPKQGKR